MGFNRGLPWGSSSTDWSNLRTYIGQASASDTTPDFQAPKYLTDGVSLTQAIAEVDDRFDSVIMSGLQASGFLAAAIAYTGMDDITDATPSYESTAYMAQGSSLENACGKLGTALAIQSGINAVQLIEIPTLSGYVANYLGASPHALDAAATANQGLLSTTNTVTTAISNNRATASGVVSVGVLADTDATIDAGHVIFEAAYTTAGPVVTPVLKVFPGGTQLPTWTVATKPNGQDRQVAICSDGNDGYKCLAVHDGNIWRAVPLGGEISATAPSYAQLAYRDNTQYSTLVDTPVWDTLKTFEIVLDTTLPRKYRVKLGLWAAASTTGDAQVTISNSSGASVATVAFATYTDAAEVIYTAEVDVPSSHTANDKLTVDVDLMATVGTGAVYVKYTDLYLVY